MDQYHEEIAAFSFMMILVTSKRQTTFTSFYIFTKTAKPSFIYAPINSKHQHPPPRANPGHLNVYFARGVGNLI